jgi:hypothetical protein
MEQEDNMFTYTIMPDYGNAAYAWMKIPGEIANNVGQNIADATGWYGKHPISKELEADFILWAIEFEREVNEETEVIFHWLDFHSRGIALTQRLKVELGADVRVIYEKPYEDHEYAIEERREILLDGSFKLLESRRGRDPLAARTGLFFCSMVSKKEVP